MWGPVVVYSTRERDKVIQQFPLIRSYDYVELAIDFRWGPTLARKDIDAACEEQSRASVVTNIFSRQRCGADGRAFIYSKSTIVNTAKMYCTTGVRSGEEGNWTAFEAQRVPSLGPECHGNDAAPKMWSHACVRNLRA